MSRRMLVFLVSVFVLGMLPVDARAGDFAFSIGRDIGAVDFTGARAVTNLGTRLGYHTGQVQVFGTADFARYTLNTDYSSPDFTDTENTGALYTLGIGGRFFFSEPKAKEAVPYVVASGFTLIPSVGGTTEPEEETTGMTGGVMAGFGAEYYFDESFSIGGELGGSGLFGYLQQETTTWQGNILQIYSGVQLNFYLF